MIKEVMAQKDPVTKLYTKDRSPTYLTCIFLLYFSDISQPFSYIQDLTKTCVSEKFLNL